MTRNAQSTLQRQLRRGGALPHDEGLDKKAVVDAAHELGLALFVANCDPARSRSAVLRAIVKAVDFPNISAATWTRSTIACAIPSWITRSAWCCGCTGCIPAIPPWKRTQPGSRPSAPTRPSSPTRMAASLRMWSSMRAVIPIPNRASPLRLTATTNKTEGRSLRASGRRCRRRYCPPAGQGRCHQPSRAAAAAISARPAVSVRSTRGRT